MNEKPEQPDKLDQAYTRLEEEAPDRVRRAIRWLRAPEHRRVRLPIGIALVILGFFGFLPILGFEFIPIGLLLIAQDVPALREPVGRFTLWLEDKWVQLRNRWQHRGQKKK